MSTRPISAKGAEASAPAAKPAKKIERFHTIGGIDCKVLRTEFDSRQNVVFDYVERIKVVRQRDGSFKDVAVERRVVAPDELQQKYVRPADTIVKIEE
jgi:hypothetical protein